MSWSLEEYGEVTSTMSVARGRAEAGAEHGTTVLAQTQTDGRGRRGRTWYSPAGGMYLTTVLRPQRPVDEFPQLALGAGIAIRAACARAGADGVRVKWPNDIVVGRKKLAGILLETLDDSAVLVGIGVNLEQREHVELDPELALRFIGLGDLVTTPPKRADFARSVLDELRTRYRLWADGGISEIVEEFEQFHVLTNERVSATGAGGQIEGTVERVDSSGALILVTQNGPERVRSGEVQFVRPTR